MKERYDLVIRKSFLETEAGQTLMTILNEPTFQREVTRFSGNDYRDLGKIMEEV